MKTSTQLAIIFFVGILSFAILVITICATGVMMSQTDLNTKQQAYIQSEIDKNEYTLKHWQEDKKE